jgi:hypothetical protein
MREEKPNDTPVMEHYNQVFLAGSIEMGKAEDWQSRVVAEFASDDVTFYNPRRDDWDSSWTQDQSNLQFNKQVNWELNRLNTADIIFFYFSPGTISPISLLELGLYIDSNPIVCCPPGFQRKGNIDIVCTRKGISVYNNLEDAMGALRTRITSNY